MTLDALDPGPNWDYPNCPRDADGFLDEVRMAITPYWQTGTDGTRHCINPEPSVRDQAGRLVPISTLVPARPRQP